MFITVIEELLSTTRMFPLETTWTHEGRTRIVALALVDAVVLISRDPIQLVHLASESERPNVAHDDGRASVPTRHVCSWQSAGQGSAIRLATTFVYSTALADIIEPRVDLLLRLNKEQTQHEARPGHCLANI